VARSGDGRVDPRELDRCVVERLLVHPVGAGSTVHRKRRGRTGDGFAGSGLEHGVVADQVEDGPVAVVEALSTWKA